MTWLQWISDVAIPARAARGVDSVGGISPNTLMRCENGYCHRLAMLRRWAEGLDLDVAVAEAAWRSYYEAGGLIAEVRAIRPDLPWQKLHRGHVGIPTGQHRRWISIWRETPAGYGGAWGMRSTRRAPDLATLLDMLLPVQG